jgi:hypothetical protein
VEEKLKKATSLDIEEDFVNPFDTEEARDI